MEVCVQETSLGIGKPKRGKVVEEEKMDSVNLSCLSMSEIPSPSINLSLISHLDISSNNIESIPESLAARMLNLESFDVHSNHITCLPYSIGCLSKLKFLNISGNMLNSIPMTIIYCRALEELNANFNKLTKLPDAIGYELHKLQKLSVNSNKLAFLPPSITHMASLRILDARLNCLRALPEDLENLLNLQVLNVSQNFHYLTALPYAIGLLLSLVELDVSYNQITFLPNSISCLKHLEKLHVEGNPLVSPPMKVARQRPEVVKAYLSDMMNNESESPTSNTSPGKKTSSTWFGKLARYQTFNGRSSKDGAASTTGDMKDGLLSDFCRSFGLRPGSPRAEMGPFSPRRLFSFKSPRRS